MMNICSADHVGQRKFNFLDNLYMYHVAQLIAINALIAALIFDNEVKIFVKDFVGIKYICIELNSNIRSRY